MDTAANTDAIHLCDYRVILIFSLNFVASPVLINLNKWIYSKQFISTYSLAVIHFLITFMFSFVCIILRIIKFKYIDILKVTPLAILFCGFVVFTSLSLQYNTVGTSQIIKTMTTPCIIMIQYVCYNKTTCLKQQLTTIPIGVGVLLNSYYDVKLNITGLTYASFGVVMTSFYQVWVGEKQRELQVNSMQLLFYQAPISALMMMLFILLAVPFDTLQNSWRDCSTETLVMILFSGVLAWLVNLSIYWIIGNTSPVTYNMIGHLKFCVTVVAGYILFEEIPNINQVCGVITTISGVTMYTRLKMFENNEFEQLSQTDIKQKHVKKKAII